MNWVLKIAAIFPVIVSIATYIYPYCAFHSAYGVPLSALVRAGFHDPWLIQEDNCTFQRVYLGMFISI